MDKPLSSSEVDIVRTHLSSVLVKPSDRITLSETYQALKDKFPGSPENVFIPALNKAIKDNKLPGMTIVRGRYGGIRLEKPSFNLTATKPQNIHSVVKDQESIRQNAVRVQSMVLQNEKPNSSIITLTIPAEVKINHAPDVEEVEEPVNEELYQEMKEIIETAAKPVVDYPKVKTTWGSPPPPVKKDLWMNGRHYQIPHTIGEIKTLLEKVLEVKEDPEGAIKFDGQTYSCSEMAMEFFDRFLFYFHGASLVVE